MGSAWIAWVFTAEGIIGLFSNLMVIIIFFRHPRLMQNDSSKFIVNQSLIDALESVLLVLSHRNLFGNFDISYAHSYSDGNSFDELVCRVWNLDSFQWALIVCSTFNLVVLTIVKYIKIVHSFWYKIHITNRVVNVLLVLPWFLGLLYQFGLFTMRADVIGTKCVYPLWPYEVMGIVMGCIAFAVQFILPISIMLFCYIRILLTIRGRHKSLTSASAPAVSTLTVSTIGSEMSHNDNDVAMGMESHQTTTTSIKTNEVQKTGTTDERQGVENNRTGSGDAKIQKKTIRMLFIVCLGFFACWVCNQILFFLKNINAITSFRGTIMYYFSIIMANANCCINPFIYLSQFRNYRSLLYSK